MEHLTKEQKSNRELRQKARENPMNKIIIEVIYDKHRGPQPRIRYDFQNCPTRAEQHSWKETNIPELMKRFKPDELAQYIAARGSDRQEIVGHDFASEPNLQEASNEVLSMKKAFGRIPEEIRNQFNSHLEFLKFIDNPANQDKMIAMGLLKKTEIEDLTGKQTKSEQKTPPQKTTPKKEDPKKKD